MGLIQSVSGFGYEIVKQTWVVSTILIKPVLVLHLGKVFYDEEITLKHLEEVIMDYSRYVVGLMFILGVFGALINLDVEPVFKVISQITALLYYAFLFWKF